MFSATAGASRVFELLDEEPDIADLDEAPALPAVSGRVAFDSVDFEYVDGEPILTDVSFVAEPGQMIGLVGPTGAGKSTIINYLLNNEQSSGNIRTGRRFINSFICLEFKVVVRHKAG